eukprot:3712867-Pyramimonas_sp.AAC.2
MQVPPCLFTLSRGLCDGRSDLLYPYCYLGTPDKLGSATWRPSHSVKCAQRHIHSVYSLQPTQHLSVYVEARCKLYEDRQLIVNTPVRAHDKENSEFSSSGLPAGSPPPVCRSVYPRKTAMTKAYRDSAPPLLLPHLLIAVKKKGETATQVIDLPTGAPLRWWMVFHFFEFASTADTCGNDVVHVLGTEYPGTRCALSRHDALQWQITSPPPYELSTPFVVTATVMAEDETISSLPRRAFLASGSTALLSAAMGVQKPNTNMSALAATLASFRYPPLGAFQTLATTATHLRIVCCVGTSRLT